MMFNFIRGFQSAFSGFAFLTHPSLRGFIFLPLFINLVVFAILLFVAYQQYSTVQQLITVFTPDFLHWLVPLLMWLLVPMVIIIGFLVASIIANILAAPFNSLLAEKLETILLGYPPPSNGKMLKELGAFTYIIFNELRKLNYILLITTLLFVIALIPGINLVSPLLWLVGGAWLLTVEYADYPMGNHNIQFRQQRVLLKQQRMLSLGFGFGILLITLIPVINFFIMPIATCSATRLWIDHFQQLSKN